MKVSEWQRPSHATQSFSPANSSQAYSIAMVLGITEQSLLKLQ